MMGGSGRCGAVRCVPVQCHLALALTSTNTQVACCPSVSDPVQQLNSAAAAV
jgi:hypothetical protein